MTELQFDFESYLANLMEAMKMNEAPPEVQQEMVVELAKQLAYRITTTISLNLSDTHWREIETWTDVKEFSELIAKIIDQNPEIKELVIKTLDEFYNETLEIFGFLSTKKAA